jgi:hypothetical protein
MSTRQIAARRHVHRRMVRQALAEPAGPPPRKQAARLARAIDPVRDVLDKLAGEPLTIWEIWTTVTDERDSDASYAAVRDYIRTRRLSGQLRPSPDQIPDERPEARPQQRTAFVTMAASWRNWNASRRTAPNRPFGPSPGRQSSVPPPLAAVP